MPQVEITIGGRSFEVACQEGEEPFLQAAAQVLDQEASALSAHVGRMPESKMLLMTGLMLADRMAGTDDRLKEAEQRAQAAEAGLGQAQAQIDAAEAAAQQAVQQAERAAYDAVEQARQEAEARIEAAQAEAATQVEAALADSAARLEAAEGEARRARAELESRANEIGLPDDAVAIPEAALEHLQALVLEAEALAERAQGAE
ncbi:cell division protein ZapA [Pseudoroseicyclus aestuarii]|uniref:Cell division protein ZapA n=1 Tax=Pseudoroseicyclus aestuarii TaxID=1795041 RepID=A0A318SZ21_9RHOB|nr:cell division protein ZapA [Pseudoroseicyclus aestuarii]